jgi:predicted N-acetyltransferase YhbS
VNLTLRSGTLDDAARCGMICHDAFRVVAEHHAFPPDFPSRESATELMSHLLGHPGFHSVVAELDGHVVGSNFLDERSAVAGIGPITVDPAGQDRAVGRRLMQHVMDRAAQRRFPSVRLVQAAYHGRSLSLYAKLGFVTREPLSTLQGPPPRVQVPGHDVRAAGERDLEACDRLCRAVHGHDRHGELLDAVRQGTATLVERAGRVTGYATQVAFFGHAVGETNGDLQALIGAAPAFPGPGFLLPTRNAQLFRWCLDHGLRVVQPMTLMTTGLYAEPQGAWLPSILY